MADKYRDFEELRANEVEGKDFVVEVLADGRRPDLVVMAPHGGKIEPHTDLLALEIAGDDLTYYAFRGIKPVNNGDLHIMSTCFNEPRALALARSARHVLAVHGAAGVDRFVMVGGGCVDLVGRLIGKLHDSEFNIRECPGRLAGRSPENICNRSGEGGAQLELSRGLRELLFREEGDRKIFVRSLRAAFVDTPGST